MDSENPQVKIRILIADDHAIFRDGLRRLLEDRGFDVIGEAGDGDEAVRLTREMRPDILLLDLAMPRVTGLATLRELEAQGIVVRTILLTASIERGEIATALQLGASGVVLKEAATQLLVKCIEAVMAGQYWVGSEGVADLVHALRQMVAANDDQTRKKRYGLTKREFEIIASIVAGFSNRDVAQKFSIREDTVKHHLTNIFNKVGVSNRLELALFAVHHRLVEDL